MMTSPSELSFDSKPSTYPILSNSSGDRDQTTEQAQKLEEFLAHLEEERLKIDAFKRELPLCMQLLNNAMEASREQLRSQRTNGHGSSSRPVLEEFIPLKKPDSSDAEQIENTENTSADKANWMTHAQLWNQESQETKPSQTPLLPSVTPQETEIKLALNGKQRTINGGAFHPFPTKDWVSLSAFPELALASSHKEEMEETKINNTSENSERIRENSSGNNNTVGEKEQTVGNNTSSTTQPHRKARRCWSPDLHRRFVNALHMLGGSQVATPKQIRELMKVDGLTNDEVKSHLQKYRLHTRRPSPSPQATVAATPQVVFVGGILVPPEYAAAAAHGGPLPPAAFYSPHHHMSPPLISPPPEGNICPAIGRPPPPAPPQMPNTHHQLLHMYNNSNVNSLNRAASFITHGGSSDDVRSSPDVQGGNNISGCDEDRHDPNSESIDDVKSESGSWKADSDHRHHHHHQLQNGSRRVVVDNEESNASVVSLNF